MVEVAKAECGRFSLREIVTSGSEGRSIII
jgi:hypothetical protein